MFASCGMSCATVIMRLCSYNNSQLIIILCSFTLTDSVMFSLVFFFHVFFITLSRPSARHHPSYGDCLEVKKEYYQNYSVLDCVTQCSQSAAHLYEQFLQVQQIGFVTLGPLRRAWRRLPRVVLL